MAENKNEEVSTCDETSNISSTEQEQFEIKVENGQLSYIGRDCYEIPRFLGDQFGPCVTRLDLSFNLLKSLKDLESFPNVQELIIDSNELSDMCLNSLPSFKHLNTLSLNKNKIHDIEPVMDILSTRIPNLTFLSLLGNTACPNELSSLDKDEEDYQRYRHYVLYRFPNLKFLDSTPVSKAELSEAQRTGPFLKVMKPSDDVDHSKTEPADKKSSFTPLPDSTREHGEHGGTFGMNKYVYYGRHSEGNRFIRNNDL